MVHFRPILGNRGERDPTADVGGLWTLKDGGRRTIRRLGVWAAEALEAVLLR